MNTDYSVLGLARRAGKLSIGHDAVIDAMRRGNAYLILLTSDASHRHEKEILETGNGEAVLHLTGDMNEVGAAAGKRACIYAVTDEGFAKMINNKLNSDKGGQG